MPAKFCGNCNWYVPATATSSAAGSGNCIFNAPQALTLVDGNNGVTRTRTQWPRVLYANLCGQWSVIVP